MSCQMSVRKKSDNSEGRIQNYCMIQLSNKESLLRLVDTCHFITGQVSTAAHTYFGAPFSRGICDQCYPL